MTEQNEQTPPEQGNDDSPEVVVLDASTMAMGRAGGDDGGDSDGERNLADLVEQPAKVMRIGSMVRTLLEEVKSAPLDEPSRARLAEVHNSAIDELEAGLAPELVEELRRMSSPFGAEATPSEAELRIAQAQLVGWLEGLFHGIQTAVHAQQLAARAQLEQMRRALPAGPSAPGAPGGPGGPGQGMPGMGGPTQPGRPVNDDGAGGGMYL